MAGMADNFRDSISTEGLQMRFEMLKDFTIEQVEVAAKHIMATRKFTKMPPIAEFLEALGYTPPSIEDQAVAAADEIIAHLNEYGSSVTPDLGDDPIAERLMTKRWPYTRWAKTILEGDIKWWRKDFIQAYRAADSKENFLQIEDSPYREGLKLITGNLFEDVDNDGDRGDWI